MPELLVELFSEEIPARFQRRAAEDLKKAVTEALVAAGLTYESAGAFVTPRRLTLNVVGLPGQSPDTREERKGPRVGSPQPAIDGFLKAAGLTDIAQAKIETDPKKGEFYVASIDKKGAPAISLIATILPKVIAEFPWPKSMRWGSGAMSWVRPLRAITAVLAAENEESVVVPFTVGGIASGRTTYGHRFLAPAAIEVRRFEDYSAALEKAKVVLDLDRRKEIIRADAEQLAFAENFALIADEGLLEEVAGLVEWPNVMMGRFDASFLAVPEEAIIATIRANQKCFCLRDTKTGRLANRFVLTANTIPADGGATIIAGNERVIRARLSDAKFFYETDLKTPLEAGVPRLQDSVFHAKLGTQAERVERIVRLAREIAPHVGAPLADAMRAARLAKADLVTQMVGEFPELQGLMGRYYATAQGEPAAIANAIEQHYKPIGPNDRVPTEPVAIAVALADKLDLLTGFWSINEKPTGSRDPFALRRAALGVIRIITENRLKLPLLNAFDKSLGIALRSAPSTDTGVAAAFLKARHEAGRDWIPVESSELPMFGDILVTGQASGTITPADDETEFFGGQRQMELETFAEPLKADLLAFFHDRLKVTLRDTGARHDLVDAVITDKSDDLLQIVRRVEALSAMLGSEDGKNLIAGYRRAANIVAAEEKKDNVRYGAGLELGLLRRPEEAALARAVEIARAGVVQKLSTDNFSGAITSLAALRQPVDGFLEADFMVNDPDPAVRLNRLNLLARLRDTMHLVADFSRIAG